MELYIETLFVNGGLYKFPLQFHDLSYVAVFTRSKMTSSSDFLYAHVNKSESTKSEMKVYITGTSGQPFSFSAMICGKWKPII